MKRTSLTKFDDDILADEDLCLAYLLGDLDAVQQEQFEHRLASDSRLAEVLLMQSDLIVQLSTEAEPAPLVQKAEPQTTWVAWVSIAIAVGLGGIIVGIWPKGSSIGTPQQSGDTIASTTPSNAFTATSPDQLDHNVIDNSETSLIAVAWANDLSFDNASDTATGVLDEMEFDDSDLIVEDATEDFNEAPNDDLDQDDVDWIFVGLTSIEFDANGELNHDEG
ncbi:hypothetical protein N9N28_06145 [Rubripirellula amarantea]|nr:hypothetical protein [Rubripirellula amarantea]